MKLFNRAPCKSCEARDYTIALLKDEIYKRDSKITELEMRIDNLNADIRRRLDRVTGMDRELNPQAGELSKIHSMQRNTGIQGRIARAEAAERDPVKIAQRKREIEERINKLMPEVEVQEDAGEIG